MAEPDLRQESAKLAAKLAKILRTDTLQLVNSLNPQNVGLVITGALDILQSKGLASAVVQQALSEAGCSAGCEAKGDVAGFSLLALDRLAKKFRGGKRVSGMEKSAGVDASPRYRFDNPVDATKFAEETAKIGKGSGVDYEVEVEKKGIGGFAYVDLWAQRVAAKRSKSALTTAGHPLKGESVWGKFAKAHFYNGLMRMEEYPPGGKTRGKTTGVYSFGWNGSFDSAEEGIIPLLEGLAKLILTKPYQACVAYMEAGAKALSAKGVYCTIDHGTQKAVNAPNPMTQLNTPNPFTNAKNVHIEVDSNEPTVTLSDLNDRMNEPRAFTQGKKAYEKAMSMYGDWFELGYNDILRFWRQNGVKVHDYLAMD